MTVRSNSGANERFTSKVFGKRHRKALGFPPGVGWCVPVPRDLLNSAAWLTMSAQCRKLVDAVMAEHADHGGSQNGELKVPYDMLQARGMRRAIIFDAIQEAKALGIVDHVAGKRSYGSRRTPSIYRLTWLGTPDGLMPTNEWKAIKTPEEGRARIRNALAAVERNRAIAAAVRADHAAHRAARRSTG